MPNPLALKPMESCPLGHPVYVMMAEEPHILMYGRRNPNSKNVFNLSGTGPRRLDAFQGWVAARELEKYIKEQVA